MSEVKESRDVEAIIKTTLNRFARNKKTEIERRKTDAHAKEFIERACLNYPALEYKKLWDYYHNLYK